MDWQSILKRKIETLADYTNASPDERRRYHISRMSANSQLLRTLRNSIANVGETNPNIPLEEDMRELQEKRNFHSRQKARIKRGSSVPDVFSPELEQQRRKVKLHTTPRGLPNPYTDLSMEEYESLNNKQKYNYHSGRLINTSGEERRFHQRMWSRIKQNSKLTTFPHPELGGETILGKTYTKEEYDNMSREDKRKYHGRMENRFRTSGDLELSKFHKKMYQRFRRNNNLPTFFSPEHQEEQ